MICYAFAVPNEAADFVRGMSGVERFAIGEQDFILGTIRGRRQVLVTYVGMGLERAGERAARVFEHFRLRAMVLAGYGGALVPQLAHGQVVVGDNYTHEEVLKFMRLLPDYQLTRFCSTDEVVSSPQRRDEFAHATQCQVVDMETDAVAAVAAARACPFITIRVITDTFDSDVPVRALHAGFDPARDRVTPVRLMLHLALHPGETAPFRRFVQGLPPARAALTKFLLAFDEELPGSW